MRSLSVKVARIFPRQFFLLSILCFLSSVSFAEPPRYEIDATIDTAKHRIAARQKVIFTNNSTRQLDEIYFHIYPHRKYTQREIKFMYRYAGYFKINPFPEGFQGGDLKINAVSCDGRPLTYVIEGSDQTILKVALNAALAPNESREITLDFTVDIPHAYGKFGWHKDIATLVRWYPILSVFDEQGWHNYPFYLYHLPHFSDASYYTVNVTVPFGQKVAATGLVKEETDNSDGTKTVRIETEFPVRDFSLGVSASFQIYTLNEGKTRINAYYINGDQRKAEEAAHNASALMKFYGERFGEYPYQDFNIVPSYLGFGGLQSSGQIFIDTRVYALPGFLERYFDFFISHETGHQWFYNMIGSDEYKEMFMDEGMNSYWILAYLESKYGVPAQVMTLPKPWNWLVPNFTFRQSSISRYLYLAKNGFDHPVIGELSSFHEPSTIFALTYGKGAEVLSMLEKRVGSAVFDKIVQRYSRDFRFKNARLTEFIALCNEESGQNLDAFFADWLETKKICDYAVTSVTKDAVVLENRGSVQMPVTTRIMYGDGKETEDQWDGKEKIKVIPLAGHGRVKSVAVDPENFISLDLDRTNNYWPRNLYTKAVPFYFSAYEIPAIMPRDSYNLILGPSAGDYGLGGALSLQKPFNQLVRFSSGYDFNDQQVESRLGYEFQHLFSRQISLGCEIYHRTEGESDEELTGGKIYLRRELWPASYGLLDLNDHVTFYLIRNQRLESSSLTTGREQIYNLFYRRRQEAIAGVTGSFGRYGTYPDPQYGWKFLPTVESAGHFLGGRESFWRSSLELDNYHLLFPKCQHTIASRLKAGWGGSGDKELFQLGGPDSLRGWRRKTFEGSRMLLGSLEYRLPLKSGIKFYFLDNVLSLNQIQAVGFIDIGKAWHADFDSRAFKKDAGIGLRFHFDVIGFLEKIIVRFDVAQAINEPKEEPHFWIGVSHTF
jgi:hypothetical protein